jgi:E3 ubiquitin-protein ligase EDD1
MRQQNSEHSDILPSLDVTAMRHVAYILDAFISLLKIEQDRNFGNLNSRASQPTSPAEGTSSDEHHIFFRRSESMLFLGSGNLEGAFEQSFNEALPLADKPHLLKLWVGK